mmetsp:Transcript_11402/g.17198  ORF Transcript_11402/g.17198 Transcript_11402/m.17198 type:complete len:95 (+) Transcript_11402:214-498(+)
MGSLDKKSKNYEQNFRVLQELQKMRVQEEQDKKDEKEQAHQAALQEGETKSVVIMEEEDDEEEDVYEQKNQFLRVPKTYEEFIEDPFGKKKEEI